MQRDEMTLRLRKYSRLGFVSCLSVSAQAACTISPSSDHCILRPFGGSTERFCPFGAGSSLEPLWGSGRASLRWRFGACGLLPASIRESTARFSPFGAGRAFEPLWGSGRASLRWRFLARAVSSRYRSTHPRLFFRRRGGASKAAPPGVQGSVKVRQRRQQRQRQRCKAASKAASQGSVRGSAAMQRQGGVDRQRQMQRRKAASHVGYSVQRTYGSADG